MSTSEPHVPPYVFSQGYLSSDVFPVGVYRVNYFSMMTVSQTTGDTCGNSSGQAVITISINVSSSPSCEGDACLTEGQLVVAATVPGNSDTYFGYLQVDGQVGDTLVLRGGHDEEARLEYDFELHVDRRDGSMVAYWGRGISFTGIPYFLSEDFYGTGGLDCDGVKAPALPTTLPYQFCGGRPVCELSGLPPCDLPPCTG